ncbi:MAG: hypothetical protein K2J67_09110 [Lachnospiraceae bacterium]|nr:hypothetical protein [Lachnospiraceae bacterium]
MKKFLKKAKYGCIILSGIVCGITSTLWCGWSILIAGNLMEDPGSYRYEEAESWRPYGILGLVFYAICFGCLLLCFKKTNISFPAFLLPMLFGILSTCAYFLY